MRPRTAGALESAVAPRDRRPGRRRRCADALPSCSASGLTAAGRGPRRGPAPHPAGVRTAASALLAVHGGPMRGGPGHIVDRARPSCWPEDWFATLCPRLSLPPLVPVAGCGGRGAAFTYTLHGAGQSTTAVTAFSAHVNALAANPGVADRLAPVGHGGAFLGQRAKPSGRSTSSADY